MHRTRLIVALFFLPVFFVIVKYLSAFFFLLVVMGAVLLGQYEFYRLFYAEPLPPIAYLGLLLGPLASLSFYSNLVLTDRFLLVGILLLVLLFQLFLFKDLKKAMGETGIIFLGIVYVGWLLGHLVLLRGISDGGLFVLFLVLVTWGGDSGSYYIGMWLGQKPLYSAVSPRKTMAGAAGGLFCSLGITFLGSAIFIPSLSVVDCIVLGILLGVLGQLGDLCESLFKRSAGKKDSGGLIPAHGGILDKIDSLLFTAPVLYYYLLFLKGYGRGILAI